VIQDAQDEERAAVDVLVYSLERCLYEVLYSEVVRRDSYLGTEVPASRLSWLRPAQSNHFVLLVQTVPGTTSSGMLWGAQSADLMNRHSLRVNADPTLEEVRHRYFNISHLPVGVSVSYVTGQVRCQSLTCTALSYFTD